MTEAAVLDVEQQRDDILAAMQNLAGAGPMAGEAGPGDIVHRGDDSLDAQMVIGKGKEAAIVYIWDTRTGERSRTNSNMIPSHMSKMRPDGSQVFTTRDPGITPKRGKLTCMLHPNAPSRTHYDQWGLGICMKDNLPSRQDVKSHMQNRHKREWATIEEERLRIKEERNESLQQAILKGAAAGAAASRHLNSQEDTEPARRGRPAKE
ncbi:MAG: hypothetical protein Q7O66_17450 [Dehalococcoidia bacterium]|nr:hypothetical protein [Dehalococcoidia bacterium]